MSHHIGPGGAQPRPGNSKVDASQECGGHRESPTPWASPKLREGLPGLFWKYYVTPAAGKDGGDHQESRNQSRPEGLMQGPPRGWKNPVRWLGTRQKTVGALGLTTAAEVLGHEQVAY